MCSRKNRGSSKGSGFTHHPILSRWAVLAKALHSASLNAQKHCPPYPKALPYFWTPPNSGCALSLVRPLAYPIRPLAYPSEQNFCARDNAIGGQANVLSGRTWSSLTRTFVLIEMRQFCDRAPNLERDREKIGIFSCLMLCI